MMFLPVINGCKNIDDAACGENSWINGRKWRMNFGKKGDFLSLPTQCEKRFARLRFWHDIFN
jgi:hypothetical protein